MKPSLRQQRRGHDGKVGYDTLEQAQRAAWLLADRKARQGNPVVTFLRAYGCPCGKFHFGKTKQIDWSKVK